MFEIMACNGPPKGPPITLNLLRSADADDFLAFAIGQRLTLYFKAKTAGRSFERPTDHERSLLDYALRSFRQFQNIGTTSGWAWKNPKKHII